MQEVLRAYSNSDPSLSSSAGPATRGSQQDNALYRALAPEVQRLVAPYLTSEYELLSKGPPRAPPETVFGSGTGVASYRDWLNQWLRQLIQHHAGGAGTCVLPCWPQLAAPKIKLMWGRLAMQPPELVRYQAGHCKQQSQCRLLWWAREDRALVDRQRRACNSRTAG